MSVWSAFDFFFIKRNTKIAREIQGNAFDFFIKKRNTNIAIIITNINTCNVKKVLFPKHDLF